MKGLSIITHLSADAEQSAFLTAASECIAVVSYKRELEYNQDTHSYSKEDRLYRTQPDKLHDLSIRPLTHQTILKYSIMSEIQTIPLKIKHQKSQTAV